MKKKVIILSLALMMLVVGVVSAAASWGKFEGYNIVRIQVDGKTVKAEDTPAVILKGRTMVPIYMLKEMGIEYIWDSETTTLNVLSQKKNPVVVPVEEGRKTLTAKEIAKLSDRVGFVEAYDYSGVLGTGSGFVIDSGLFITNSHVAANGSGIRVKIDGVVYDSKSWYLFNNPTTDVYAVFLSSSYNQNGGITGQSPTRTLPYVTTLPEIGDKVYLIASPQGYENTVTEGIVSGIRSINGVEYIQHTAGTEFGSSGGVLLNEYGEAIGIHSWVNTSGDSLKFAVPMKYVQSEIDYLLSK